VNSQWAAVKTIPGRM